MQPRRLKAFSVLFLQNKRTCNSTVDNLLILLGQLQQKNERSSREKRAHLRAMMLPDQRLCKEFESGGGAEELNPI